MELLETLQLQVKIFNEAIMIFSLTPFIIFFPQNIAPCAILNRQKTMLNFMWYCREISVHIVQFLSCLLSSLKIMLNFMWYCREMSVHTEQILDRSFCKIQFFSCYMHNLSINCLNNLCINQGLLVYESMVHVT